MFLLSAKLCESDSPQTAIPGHIILGRKTRKPRKIFSAQKVHNNRFVETVLKLEKTLMFQYDQILMDFFYHFKSITKYVLYMP